MIIQVNGEPRETAGPLTIGALLTQLDIDPRRVAVEHNLIVVKRDLYDTTIVGHGDTIEIVNFVGGGQDVETGGQDDSTGGQELFNRRAGAQETPPLACGSPRVW